MAAPVRLALLAASPMYYQAPLYRRLAADPRLDFTAIFASNGGLRPHEAGYGQPITWDVDAMSGYRSRFLAKADTNPIDGSTLSLVDRDVVGVLRSGRYEALWLHGYNFATHLMAAATQRATGGHLLFREEQTLLHRRPLPKRIVKTPALRLLFSQGRSLYIGTQNRRWFAHYGVPPERQFFVPYCVDNERMQDVARRLAPERDALRDEFGLPADRGPLIVSVARLVPKKQPEFLLEAFRRVRERHRCCLLFVGSGDLEESMRRQVAEARIPDVAFTSFLPQSQVPRAYAAADVFALVSKAHETWGLAVNEAMNFALPVVVSDRVGCAIDLVANDRNGFVVAHDDVEQLAASLERLVTSDEERARLGEASLERVTGWHHGVAAEGVAAAVADAVGPARWREAGGG